MRLLKASNLFFCYDFNPRTSYEVRPCRLFQQSLPHPNFNPRTSYEVRPNFCFGNCASCSISIHAPHTRCDCNNDLFRYARNDFNPRTSYEVRLSGQTPIPFAGVISIHAPHTRCDFPKYTKKLIDKISIHAPHTRCDKKQ